MTEFYNKYRRLFTDPDQHTPHLPSRTRPKPTLSSPIYSPVQDAFPKKQQKLGDSPALHQFEHYILPRLKTEPVEAHNQSAHSMRNPFAQYYPLPQQRLPALSFETKPRNSTYIRKEEPRYLPAPPNHALHESALIESHSKQEIPPSISGPHHDLKAIKRHIFHPPNTQSPSPKHTQEEQINRSVEIQRQEPTSPKNKVLSVYECQLYGINDNPYAFANAKLADIRLIQRFYPRGIVNKYKVCLLRRHQKKGELPSRRQRLRQLLRKDETGLQKISQ